MVFGYVQSRNGSLSWLLASWGAKWERSLFAFGIMGLRNERRSSVLNEYAAAILVIVMVFGLLTKTNRHTFDEKPSAFNRHASS